MRVTRLILLALIAFIITAIVRFPAAPVVDHFRPQLGPVALEGVEGPLIAGSIGRARSTDDLLPLELSNVAWKLAPQALLQGAGANISFDGYGGSGEAQVLRAWNGDIRVEDVLVTAQAKALEPLLPVPVAAFSGALSGDLTQVVLREQLLTTFEGALRWENAVLERPFPANFGTLDIDVDKTGDETHVATLSATGGDVAVEGTVTVSLNGDFVSDILMTLADSASNELRAAIARVAQPDSAGRFRVQQSGNVNRLM